LDINQSVWTLEMVENKIEYYSLMGEEIFKSFAIWNKSVYSIQKINIKAIMNISNLIHHKKHSISSINLQNFFCQIILVITEIAYDSFRVFF